MLVKAATGRFMITTHNIYVTGSMCNRYVISGSIPNKTLYSHSIELFNLKNRIDLQTNLPGSIF